MALQCKAAQQVLEHIHQTAEAITFTSIIPENSGSLDFDVIDGNPDKMVPLPAGIGSGSYKPKWQLHLRKHLTADLLTRLASTVLSVGGSSPNYTYSRLNVLGNTVTTAYSTTPLILDTTFGCNWNSTGSSPSAYPFPSSVSFPDGSLRSWLGKQTMPTAHTILDVSPITLPTGGIVSYSYSGGTNGIDCETGNGATLTRTTPDFTWTYVSTGMGFPTHP